MASWISSWLNGITNKREDSTEQQKNDENIASEISSPSETPSVEEIRRKRLVRLQIVEQKRKENEDEETLSDEKIKDTIQNREVEEGKEIEPIKEIIESNGNRENENSIDLAEKIVTSPFLPPLEAETGANSLLDEALKLNETKSDGKVTTTESGLTRNQSVIEELLKRVLHVTLSKEKDSDLIYLPEVAADMCGSCGKAAINEENASEVFYGRLIHQEHNNETRIEFLYKCYSRCCNEISKLSNIKVAEEIRQNMNACCASIKRMCIDYSCLVLSEPTMFPQDLTGSNMIALENALLSGTGLPPGYLSEVVNALENEGNVNPVFSPLFQSLVSKLLQLQPSTVLSNFYPAMQAIKILCQEKPLATVFASIPGFLLLPGSPRTGQQIQHATALGIMLRFSTDGNDPAIADMFKGLSRMKKTKAEVERSFSNLRTQLSLLQELVVDIIRLLLKAGQTPKQQVLQWLYDAIEINAELTKENPSFTVASSAGLVINVCVVMLRLCGPFLDLNSSKSNLINPEFLKTSTTCFPADETRLIVEEGSTLSFSLSPNDYNFITQCFFMTCRAIHLGPMSQFRKYMRMMQQLSYLSSHLEQDPRYQQHFDMLLQNKMTMEAYLLKTGLLEDVVRFCNLSCKVLKRIFIPGFDENAFTLPLVEKPSDIVRYIPEHLVEDIASMFLFIARVESSVINCVAMDELMSFIIILMTSPQYVRSPHLRANLSDLLYEVFLPSEEAEARAIDTNHPLAIHELSSNELVQNHLAPALLALYGDVEHTGFYAKLEHRYKIACILKYLWKIPNHRAAFVKISQDKNTFVSFANGLMNHINNLLTEALTSLPEIRSLQEEMADVKSWMAQEESIRNQKQELFDSKEKTVTSSLQLANETIHMMSYLTTEIKEPFLVPELEDRLVSMLNNVLLKLAGPRGVELKVSNPEQYKFRPKIMLQEVVETILHFTEFNSFQVAVASNGFYKAEVFQKCTVILKRIKILSDESIAAFEEFSLNVKKLFITNEESTESLGDIPDEFLDPLMCTLMKDPVELPSGFIVDRATISQHLLNDPTDPFTRAPLNSGDLVSKHSLRQKIENWLKECKTEP